jgi:hypothetical protein
MIRRFGRILTFLGFCLVASCQDSGRGAKSPDSSETASEDSSGEDDDASVYDEDGAKHHCRIEKSDCKDIKLATAEFEEQCLVEGHRIVRCGCRDYCSGNARSGELHYDAKNQGTLCEPARECEPTQTSAAFQDTCAESGGRFVQCGCAWRCSRKLKFPVAERPKPVEPPPPPPEENKKGKKGKKKITTLDG